jgi:hypothetical protein
VDRCIALAVSAGASLPRLDVSSVRSGSDANLAYITSWIAGRGTIVNVTGWLDEAVAECYGMRTIAHTAVRLGRTRAEGRWLAERYARRFYPRRESPYASPECRNGGRLDLRPGSDVWL